MAVANMINIVMRVFQFIWTLLIMSLVGNMIAEAYSGNPSIVNYDMFVAVFGMLTLLYLVPAAFVSSIAHPMIMSVLDGLNVIFFLVGGIATAAYLGVHSCTNQDYISTNIVTDGAADQTKRCREAQATTAFLWFGFAAFAVTTVTNFMGGSSGSSRGVRRGPAMSQV